MVVRYVQVKLVGVPSNHLKMEFMRDWWRSRAVEVDGKRNFA